MSWGIKIILSFVIFAAGVILMVAISFRNNTDLVTGSYYEEEIKYQDKIDLIKKSQFLNEKISTESNDREIIITVSDKDLAGRLTGEIDFYRADDAGKDFNVMLNLDLNAVQKISTENLKKGLWKMKFNLNSMSEKYFLEKNIFIE